MLSLFKRLFKRKKIPLSVDDDKDFKSLNPVIVEVIRWNDLEARGKVNINVYSDNLAELINWLNILHVALLENKGVPNSWKNMERTLGSISLDDYLLDGRYELTHDNLELIDDLALKIKDKLLQQSHGASDPELILEFYKRIYFSIFHDLIIFKNAIVDL